jgi:hypothetical protein
LALRWFVEARHEGAFEVGVAEIADDDGGGKADEDGTILGENTHDGQTAADLDAYDSPGLLLRCLWKG